MLAGDFILTSKEQHLVVCGMAPNRTHFLFCSVVLCCTSLTKACFTGPGTAGCPQPGSSLARPTSGLPGEWTVGWCGGSGAGAKATRVSEGTRRAPSGGSILSIRSLGQRRGAPSPWPPLTLSNLQHCAPNYSQNVSKGYERLTSPKPEQCHFQEVLIHWLTTKPIHFHFFFLSSTLSLEFLQSIQYWVKAGIRFVKVFSKQDNNWN